MRIKLLITVSLIAVVASCSSSSSGPSKKNDELSTTADGPIEGISEVKGSGSSVEVEGIELNAGIASQGGTAFIYNETGIDNDQFIPTGIIAGSSQIVFGMDPSSDSGEMLVGIDSDKEHTTELSDVSAHFEGSYAETFSSANVGSGMQTGSAEMDVDFETAKMTLGCDGCLMDGIEMTWGSAEIDGEEVIGFVNELGGYGLVGATVFGGDEVVGAYGTYIPDGVIENYGDTTVTGTFGGVASD